MAGLKKNAMNQILFTMVDKTDFASPESGITASDFNSAATKKVFGITHGVSTAFTSATISKAVTLVRSAIFQQTLKAAECNFDQIMVVYKHPSCADQMLVFDLPDNDDSDIMSAISDMNSKMLVMSGILSDVYSNLVVNASRALLTQSRVSDMQSALIVSDSLLSDIYSNLVVNASRALLTQSRVSDIQSLLAAGVPLDASTISDIRSAIAAGPAATVTASDISDIASAVKAAIISELSDIMSAAVQTNSRVLLNLSRVSDIYSLLSDVQSDFQSRVPKRVATDSQLSNLMSDLLSNLGTSLTTSSDIASAVWAEKYTAASNVKASSFGSLARLNMSRVSDIYSLLSDLSSDVIVMSGILSDVYSNLVVNASRALLTQSRVSDLQSAIAAGVPLDASTMSDIRSAVAAVTVTVSASDISDIASAVKATLASDLSDIYSNLVVNASRALLTQSRVSDIYSLLSDVSSDLGVMSGVQSDIQSAVTVIDDFLDTGVAAILAAVDTEVAAIKAKTDNLPVAVKKNTALANFMFFMVLASDSVTPATGLTITAERSLDGAAFAACANAITEMSAGWYKISLATTDLNGDTVAFKFTAATAKQRDIFIVTQT